MFFWDEKAGLWPSKYAWIGIGPMALMDDGTRLLAWLQSRGGMGTGE